MNRSADNAEHEMFTFVMSVLMIAGFFLCGFAYLKTDARIKAIDARLQPISSTPAPATHP
jgi:hypothetical protein